MFKTHPSQPSGPEGAGGYREIDIEKLIELSMVGAFPAASPCTHERSSRTKLWRNELSNFLRKGQEQVGAKSEGESVQSHYGGGGSKSY